MNIHTGESAEARTLTTFVVQCAETMLGDSIRVVGSLPELGDWDTNKSAMLHTSDGVFPRWNGSASVPTSAKFEFKFLIRRADGSVQFERFASNRTACAHGTEATLNCGTFDAFTETHAHNPAATLDIALDSTRAISAAAFAHDHKYH
jgi:alpha-amylase